jgi:dihydrolipoamide dehydrogenase
VVLAETPQYDVVVIGSGPGGYVAAIRSGQLGMKTAIVEKDDKFGGTCLHVGCIPTKSLLFSAEVYDYFRNAKDFGIACKEFSFNWQDILARKAKVVTKLSKGVEFLLKKNHVDTVRGFAKLAGPGKISVTDSKGVAQEIAAKNLVLATGSEARLLPGLEPDGKTLLTNPNRWSLSAPAR